MEADKFINPNTDPFQHYWIENFLSQEQYQKIIDIKNHSEFNAVGDSSRASVSLGHSDYLDQVSESFIINDKTKSILTDVFWPSITYQYPKATKEDVIRTAWVEGMIVKDTEGYEMPPHQDGGSFIVGYAQLFLAEETDDYHGIVLHRSLDPERKMDMTKATHMIRKVTSMIILQGLPTEAVVTYPCKKLFMH